MENLTLMRAAGSEVLLAVDFSREDLEIALEVWLELHMPDVHGDIEFWQGGSVDIDFDAKVITFSGDNGLFVLEPVEIQVL